MKDWTESSKDRNGDMSYTLINVTANGNQGDFSLSADYRFFGYMNVTHYGWFGYQFTDEIQGHFGITKVPFGILPYESNNYWLSIPFYVGLNYDFDMGFKFLYKKEALDIQLAFFKNSEQSPSDTKSTSFDPVTNGDDQLNEATNQLNGRVAYTFNHGKKSFTELGLSLEYGQLYNTGTKNMGDHSAYAAHLNGYYGAWNLQLEAISYQYNPENPDGVSDDVILMGAFADSYLVAAKANIIVANISYKKPVNWGPIKSLLFYHDYSKLLKDKSNFEDSVIRTLGMSVSAGPIWANIDFITGENAAWLNGQNNPFAQGSENEGANTLTNINVGYYF